MLEGSKSSKTKLILAKKLSKVKYQQWGLSLYLPFVIQKLKKYINRMVEGCIGILQMAIQEGGKNPTQSGLIFYCHIFQEFYNLNHPIYSDVLNQLG